MSPAVDSASGPAILSRALAPDAGGLSREAAEAILRIRLSEEDRERVNDLAARSRAGALTPREGRELDEYERVACLLETLQSKARRSLAGSPAPG